MDGSRKYTSRYSGPNRSGICKCGYFWEDHHLGVVMNQQYYDETGERYVPQECDYCLEDKCDSYKDKLDDD